MLLEVFIIQKGTSFLLARKAFTKKEIRMDGSLFSGMISAISLFTNELKIGEIQFFETNDYRILIHSWEKILIVGIVEEKDEDEFIISTLKIIAQEFWKQFQYSLENWNGDTAVFENFPITIDEIFYSEFAQYYIERNYPNNVISVIRSVQFKFEPHILRFIGIRIGETRSTTISQKQMKKITSLGPDFPEKQILKLVEKEINHFSISEVEFKEVVGKKTIQITLKICPICRGIHDNSFSCDFIIGFIHGYLNGINLGISYNVFENECHAHGNQYCVFSAILQQEK
ncbi:hypothetical protein [Candidatus Harpocratesius sp.]